MKTRKNKILNILVITAIAGIITLLAACSDVIGIHFSGSGSGGSSSDVPDVPGGGSSFPPSYYTNLWSDSWYWDGIYSYGEEAWYSFYAYAGNEYYIWWDDGYDGSGSASMGVKVSAYSSNGDNIFFKAENGYYSPQHFYAYSSGYIYIKVEPRYNGATGSFAIAYNNSGYRPYY